ncbi:MAG: hypothetical protein ACFHHU_04935 [Porticoccaceae bacterium]
MGKKPAELFSEFEGNHGDELDSGDVKYHQGFSSDIQTEGGELHLAMAFNPSHLEIVQSGHRRLCPFTSGSPQTIR